MAGSLKDQRRGAEDAVRFESDDPAFLRFLAWSWREGLIGRFLRCWDRRLGTASSRPGWGPRHGRGDAREDVHQTSFQGTPPPVLVFGIDNVAEGLGIH